MWLAPAPLSAAGQNAEAPQVSVNAQGDAVALWQRAGVIEASGRPAGSGSWQTPATVSTAGLASAPQVGLDSRGNAIAAWLNLEGTEYWIEASTRSGLSGAWQPPVKLRDIGMSILEPPGPKLAIDPGGDALVVWPREEKFIEAASRPAGGSFHVETPLSSTGAAQHPAVVAVDAAGDAMAVWEDDKTGEVLINAARRPAGGSWQPPVALSAAGHNANEPRVAMNASGDAVAAWERPEAEEVIEAASRPASSGTWSKSVALTKPEGGKGEPADQQVAIDAQGNTVATWSRTDAASHDFIEATEGRISTSAWRPPVSVSGPGANVEEAPSLAVNGQGSALIAWERSNGSNEVIEAASGLAASGAWQAPVALSAPGQNAAEADVALDERGDAAATWQRSDGKDLIAEAAINDIGPQLSSLTIPTVGVPGQKLSFAVSPLSPVWPAAATTWSFGDGATATGTAVTHAYSAVGTYQVTVTSTDTIGGSTSAAGAVAVAAPPRALLRLRVAAGPKITGARLTHSHFRVSKRATAVSASFRAPQGTSFHFTLSQAAKLRIAFKRSVAGLRSGKRCLAPSKKLRRRHAKRCSRTLAAGALLRAHEHKGANVIAFSGRLGTKALAPGVYRAALTASANGVSSAPVTLSLTIVR